jgi:hypothetical protein
MRISGPITTVYTEHICHELTVVARVGLATSRWLSDRGRSAGVVLGNHPISVSRTELQIMMPKAIIGRPQLIFRRYFYDYIQDQNKRQLASTG